MRIAVCCAADEKTKYLTQAVRWAQSMRWFGPPCDLFVGLTTPCPDYYRESLMGLGANLVPVPVASDWHGPSNKIGVLLEPSLAGYDFVILSDCDIVAAADFSGELVPGRLRAKPADLATVDDALLARAFESAGLPLPDRRVTTTVDRVTMLPYCNSGFIVFPGDLLPSFVARWLHWNAHLLARPELLDTRTFFTDQVSFALALSEHLDRYDELPPTINFPCHLEPARYPDDLHGVEPSVLHYHDRVDGRTGLLLPTTLPGPDRAIARFNARASGERRSAFSNPVFWDERYLRMPELGSGLGSRGEHNAMKAGLVADFLARRPDRTLADFGCGDCAILDHLAPAQYLGIDGSREIVERNRARFPQYQFKCAQLDEVEVGAPLSLCFDVLIHQPSREAFDAVIDRIVANTAEAGIINGFDEDPRFESDIVYFHRPLAVALAERGLCLRQIASYRSTPVYEWWRP
jgi:hypothetical protein